MASSGGRPQRQGKAVAAAAPEANKLQQQRIEIAEMHQGPIPAPQTLLAYDQLLPGAADRIIAMAEREQAHRMNLEDMSQRADIRHRDEVLAAQRKTAFGVFLSDALGQVAGWVIGAGCVAGAVYTAIKGVHVSVPIALVGLPVASIIKAIRSTSSSSDRAKK